MTSLTEVRTGVLDLNDFADLEEAYGPLDEIDFKRMAVIRRVLWLHERHEKPEITEREAGALYTAENIAEKLASILSSAGLSGSAEGNDEPAVAGNDGETSTGES